MFSKDDGQAPVIFNRLNPSSWRPVAVFKSAESVRVFGVKASRFLTKERFGIRVEQSLREHHIHSKTADYQDVRRHVMHQVEEFVEAIQAVPGQVGAVFFGKNGVIGAEYLHSPDLFARCLAKIVRSFSFETLSSPSLNGTSADPAKRGGKRSLNLPSASIIQSELGMISELKPKIRWGLD